MLMLIIRSKGGQYFIVAAVILIILAMGLVASNLIGPRDRHVFAVMRNNFVTESHMAINSAIASDMNIQDSYLGYVVRFREYAESRNIDFDLVYMLLYNDTIVVTNLIGQDIEVITTHQRDDLSHGDVSEFYAERFMEIYLGGTYYSFEFGEDDVQLRAMFDISVR